MVHPAVSQSGGRGGQETTVRLNLSAVVVVGAVAESGRLTRGHSAADRCPGSRCVDDISFNVRGCFFVRSHGSRRGVAIAIGNQTRLPPQLRHLVGRSNGTASAAADLSRRGAMPPLRSRLVHAWRWHTFLVLNGRPVWRYLSHPQTISLG